ncbi:hydrophobic surface binding protein A-domain-containing protein [Aspergillus pseudoustus]|uniref:Hydrophobic surface binding protein A-domain-containing protein n=1 Tax=Aspergillus pseudoustus TaxID=1810923 RepID=A0ABR4JMA6_9EURO
MKLATGLLTLALTYSAFAEPIPHKKRALADYTGVFDGISAQVAAVADSVSAYVGGTSDADAVQTASNQLSTTINDGASAIPGFDPLENADALALVSPIQDLTSDVSDLVDAVIGAKTNFDADGRSADVLSSLQDQQTASEALRDAITPKVPDALQSTAEELANGIVSQIQRGIEAYSG